MFTVTGGRCEAPAAALGSPDIAGRGQTAGESGLGGPRGEAFSKVNKSKTREVSLLITGECSCDNWKYPVTICLV